MKQINTSKGMPARGEHAGVNRSARIGALLVLGLALSGCTIGKAGFQEFSDGNYQKAHESFSADYKNNPGSSVAQINMADSYRQRGENDKANVLFRQAASSGKGVHPDGMLESHDSSTTIADVACRHLAEDRQSDPNCP
jgi:hypothetical protein